MLDRGLAAEREAISAARISQSNPYVGPRSLELGEPIFGRASELLDLRDLLLAERIVLLYSPWGAGKTSLIQAGLIPAMEKEEFDVLPVIRVGKESAAANGNRYVASALASLQEKLPPAPVPLPAEEIAELSLAAYLERRRDVLRYDSTLLIFDQFEEILMTDPHDQETKAEFFRQVGAVLRDKKRWALFALREDYIAALDPYARTIPTRLKATFRLDLLTPEGAKAAIEEPAARQGVTFEPAATTHLVEDLRRVTARSRDGKSEDLLGPVIEPVHLQVVCLQLWEKPRAEPAKIGSAEIASIGNVDTALAEYYAEQVRKVVRDTGVKEKMVREWFNNRLITDTGIRTEVMWKPGGEDGLNDAAIAQLEAAHLIRRDERRDATWLELSHTRLVNPIRTNNARWFESNLSLLQQQAALWQQQNQNAAILLRGPALLEADEWAEQHPEELTKTDRDFLAESHEKEELRSSQRIRRWAVALLFFGLLMSGLALYAWSQRNEARAQRSEAQKQERIASARGLAALAYRLFDDRLDLATVLAYEALQRMDLPETRGTLLAATLYNPRLISFLYGHLSPIGAIAFTHDGSLVALGDYSSRIALWNVKTHRPERVLPKFFKDAVRAIAFSADGNYMAASSKDGSIVLRDLRLADDTPITFLSPKAPGVDTWSIAFSSDSTLLASADSKGRVAIWNVVTRDSMILPEAAGKETRCVAFSAKGSFVAAGDQDGNILVWQRQGAGWSLFDKYSGAAAPEPERSRRGSRITCLAFSPQDDNLLASGSRDWTVNLRHVSEKRNVAQGRHWGSLNSVAFSPDGKIIASGAQDGTLRLWNLPKGSSTPAAPTPPADAAVRALEAIGRPLNGHVGWVLAVAFSPDGRTVASGGIDRQAILWDTQYAVPEGPNAGDTTTGDFVLGLHPDGKLIVTGYADGRVICHDRATNQDTALPGHKSRIRSIDFSYDGRFMISSSSDNSAGLVMVNEVASLDKDPIQIPIAQKITYAALSPDGKQAAVAANGGEILLWDLEKREQLGESLKGLEEVFVYALLFSPDGKRVSAGGNNQCALTWDLATRKATKQFVEHNGSVRAIQFSPDNTILVTASGDNTVLFSDPVTGKPLGPALTGHRGPVVTLAFRPDGKMLASGSEDKGVVLWDVATRQQVGPRLVKHVDAVRALDFSADGKELLSVSSPKDAVTWDLDLSSLAARSRARANRNLTVPEWHAYMEGAPRRTWPDLPAASTNITQPESQNAH